MIPTNKDYFEWDIITWSSALICWDNYFSFNPLIPNAIALEIGVGVEDFLYILLIQSH